jgi:hypothetical protein
VSSEYGLRVVRHPAPSTRRCHLALPSRAAMCRHVTAAFSSWSVILRAGRSAVRERKVTPAKVDTSSPTSHGVKEITASGLFLVAALALSWERGPTP